MLVFCSPLSLVYADEPTNLNQVSHNPQTIKADAVLDQLHRSAAAADWDSYFELFTDDAGFVGTDISEHWSMQDFERYARTSKGWSYKTQSRTMVRHGDVVVFDEILDNTNYGLCRGTGTMVLTEDGWKILQYHLSFPIPNELAPRITDQIKVFRKKTAAKGS
ncbi:nuclear transport factor 2 family protein [Shewanella yunxiaonensis]|uniref:Nuclear transport factor 2 family protein n=1 Tax=Shewanella yunxiaonensis TaxID=2829809 RepID=A0ABX7YQ50_9GAMM|nr:MULTISPECIES: nuclear transport factor 2 family protein [Shewanella]MDF0534818.1 nuclear transport factor 2 family protein [Shewanella sp. A32]QUN04765.1 nuclear transport factor 2 family protein [Shewanella yunxiaonensis]